MLRIHAQVGVDLVVGRLRRRGGPVDGDGEDGRVDGGRLRQRHVLAHGLAQRDPVRRQRTRDALGLDALHDARLAQRGPRLRERHHAPGTEAVPASVEPEDPGTALREIREPECTGVVGPVHERGLEEELRVIDSIDDDGLGGVMRTDSRPRDLVTAHELTGLRRVGQLEEVGPGRVDRARRTKHRRRRAGQRVGIRDLDRDRWCRRARLPGAEHEGRAVGRRRDGRRQHVCRPIGERRFGIARVRDADDVADRAAVLEEPAHRIPEVEVAAQGQPAVGVVVEERLPARHLRRLHHRSVGGRPEKRGGAGADARDGRRRSELLDVDARVGELRHRDSFGQVRWRSYSPVATGTSIALLPAPTPDAPARKT